MSRVIKFRYVWVFEGSVAIGEYTLNEIEKGLPIAPKTKRKSWDLKSRDEFTGLKDKNGVEIFEGDIIPYHGKNYPVVMSGPSWTLSEYEDLDYYGHDAPELQDWSEFEVIGNIHQNPELLEQ